MKPTSSFIRHALLISTALAALSTAAFAERADRDKPTNIEANQMFYDDSKQLNTFVGNVVVTRGTLVMHGEKLILKKDSAGYQFGTLFAPSGGLATFRQKRDGGKDLWMEGQAAQTGGGTGWETSLAGGGCEGRRRPIGHRGDWGPVYNRGPA